LGIIEPPTAIEHIEKTIAEEAFKNGYIQPELPGKFSGKKVAVVGSGPAGLAAADHLNKAGHWVVVYERDKNPGGLLRYGIPHFKLETEIVDRRIMVMEQQGIFFKTNANVGGNVPVDYILKVFDAILLAGGSTIPRDLEVTGRELIGVHFAMDFLVQQNRRNDGEAIPEEKSIMAENKHVVVIGGGDTGADCVGTSSRHRAKSITQIEILPKPPEQKNDATPWPEWPNILRTSSSHQEGCKRMWSTLTKEFINDGNGNVKAIKIVDIEWSKASPGKRPTFNEIPGTEREIPADLVLLAMGFVHPQHKGMITEFGVELDARGNVKCHEYMTNVDKIFSAGDMRRGQSLVVWALTEGREAARSIDKYLTGKTELESKNKSIFDISTI
jgi:glutamate synthase (NADPH) small chain